MSLDKVSALCKVGIGFALGFIATQLMKKLGQEKEERGKQKLEQQDNPINVKEQQQLNKKELTELAQLQQLLIHKSGNFQLESLPANEGILTKKCLFDFLMQTSDLIDPQQVIEITLESRKARRHVFPEIDQKYETYFRFVCTLDENIKYIIEKAQKDFSVFLNIDFRKIMDSITYYIDEEEMDGSEDFQFRLQIVQIMTSIRQNLANYLPLYGSPLSKQKLQQILQFQTKVLEEQKDYLVSILKKMGLESKEQEQALPLFLASYLEDIVWQQFKIESEQMSVPSQDLSVQLKNKFIHFKKVREEVIRQMHQYIQDDIIIEQ